MERYYKTNIKALPFRLVWSWGNPAAFLAFLVRKVLPFPAYGPTLVPELSVVEVPEEAADPDLSAELAQHREQLEALGYRTALLYEVPTCGPSRGLGRAFLSADRKSLCLLISVRTGHVAQVTTAITSTGDDGRVIGTSSAVLRLPAVPGIDVARLPGAPADTVARHHASRVTAFPANPLEPSDVVPFLREQQQRTITYYVAQGIYVLASERDVERSRSQGNEDVLR